MKIFLTTLLISMSVFADFSKVSPTDSSFSFDLKNGPSFQINYTLKNTGSVVQSLSTSLSGPDSSKFKVSLNRCVNVGVNKSCSIVVSSVNISVGSFSFSLGPISQNVNVMNTSTPVAPPSLVTSAKMVTNPNEIQFSSNIEKNKSVSYTIINDGPSNISSLAIQMSENPNNARIFLNRCLPLLKKGAQCMISYKFTNPGNGNIHNQTIKIMDGATEKNAYSFQVKGVSGSAVITYQIGSFSNWSACSASVCSGNGVQTRSVSRCDKYSNGVLDQQNVSLINCLGLEVGQVSQPCQSPAGSRTIDFIVNSQVVGSENQSCSQGSTTWVKDSISCNGESNIDGSGYHKEGSDLSSQTCVSNSQSCSSSSILAGIKKWNGSTDYDLCIPSSCVGESNIDGSGFHLSGSSCVSNSRSCSVIPQYASGQEIWDGSSYSSCQNITCNQGTMVNGVCTNYLPGLTLMNNYYENFAVTNYYCRPNNTIGQLLNPLNLGPSDNMVYMYQSPNLNQVVEIPIEDYMGGVRCTLNLAPNTSSTAVKNFYKNPTNFIAYGGGYFLRLSNAFGGAGGGPYGPSYIYITSTMRSELLAQNFTKIDTILASIFGTSEGGTYPKYATSATNFANNPIKIITTPSKIYYTGSSYLTMDPLFQQNKGKDDAINITNLIELKDGVYNRDLVKLTSSNERVFGIASFNNKLIYSISNTTDGMYKIISRSDSGTETVLHSCPEMCNGLSSSSYKEYNGKLYISLVLNSAISNNSKLFSLDSNENLSEVYSRTQAQDMISYGVFFNNSLFTLDVVSGQKAMRIDLTNGSVHSYNYFTYNSSQVNYRFGSSTFTIFNNILVAMVKDVVSNNHYLAKYNSTTDDFELFDLQFSNSSDGIIAIPGNNVMYFGSYGNLVYKLSSFDGTTIKILENVYCFASSAVVNKLNDNLIIECDGLNTANSRVYDKDGFVSNLNKRYFSRTNINNATVGQTQISPNFSDFKSTIVYKGKMYFTSYDWSNPYAPTVLYSVDEQNNITPVSGGLCSSSQDKVLANSEASFIIDEGNLYFSGTDCKGQSSSLSYDKNTGSETIFGNEPFIYELMKLYIP